MKRSSYGVERAAFDILRARLESEVARPGVIAMASCTDADGQEIAARTLAYSFATAGYSTLLIDTSLASENIATPAPGLDIDEIGRRQPVPDVASGQLGMLALNDLTLQRGTSQRRLQSGLDILRRKFDYVLLTTDYNVSTAFATATLNSADAVIVCVRTGRRRTTGDARLSAFLDRLGARYLGVITISDPSSVHDDSLAAFQDAVMPQRDADSAPLDVERQGRGMAEAPT